MKRFTRLRNIVPRIIGGVSSTGFGCLRAVDTMEEKKKEKNKGSPRFKVVYSGNDINFSPLSFVIGDKLYDDFSLLPENRSIRFFESNLLRGWTRSRVGLFHGESNYHRIVGTSFNEKLFGNNKIALESSTLVKKYYVWMLDSWIDIG